MLEITINQVPAMVELCRKSKNNLLIVGDPGVGKSQVLNGLANEHCKVTMMTGSSTYEETVNGIPRDNREKNVQDYTRMQWFVDILEWSKEHTDKDDYQILGIDEFNTADPQVLKTFLSILSDRKIPTQPEPLPDNVVIVAAMNPADQNEGEELIRPMASRFLTVSIKSTIESFKSYLLAEPVNEETTIEIADEPTPIERSRMVGYLEQVLPTDWQNFKPGSYHEINPRSMDNFFRAMSWVAKPKMASPLLSMAFFGKTYKYPDTIVEGQRKAEVRAKKVKNGDVNPTYKELEAMDTNTLRELNEKMLAKGGNGVTVVANIMQILTLRGEEI